MSDFPPVLTLSGEPLAHTGEEVGAPLLPLFDSPSFVPHGMGQILLDETLLRYEEGLTSNLNITHHSPHPPSLDALVTPRPLYEQPARYLSPAERHRVVGRMLNEIRDGAQDFDGEERQQLMRIRADLSVVHRMYTDQKGIPENPALRRSTPLWIDTIWRPRNLGAWKYRIRHIRRRLFRTPRGQRLVFRIGLPVESPMPHRYRPSQRTRRAANERLAEIRRGLTGRLFWPFRGAMIHAHILTGVFSHSTLVFAVALARPVAKDKLQTAILDRLRTLCPDTDLGIQFCDSQDHLRQLDIWSNPFVDGDPTELYHRHLADYLLAERGRGTRGQARCFNSRGILAPRTRRLRGYPREDRSAVAAERRAALRQTAASFPGGMRQLWLIVALKQLRDAVRRLRWLDEMPSHKGRQLELAFSGPAPLGS